MRSGSEDTPSEQDVEMSNAGNVFGGNSKGLRTDIQVFRK